jgi:myo-inositol-1(or 4)-monophosphatase
VACGRYDGFWELNLFPWDTAAGLIMVREAGGRVTRFDGSPYTPYEKNILATNGVFHNEVIGVLKGL